MWRRTKELLSEIRTNFKDSRPGLSEGWPDHRRELAKLALTVPLRETNKAVQQEKAASNVALEVSKPSRIWAYHHAPVIAQKRG